MSTSVCGMEEGAAERTGLFVVRAWRERDVASFRGRITWTVDVMHGDSHLAAVAGPDEVSRALEAWLEAFSAD